MRSEERTYFALGCPICSPIAVEYLGQPPCRRHFVHSLRNLRTTVPMAYAEDSLNNFQGKADTDLEERLAKPGLLGLIEENDNDSVQ